jgi:two-component system response regulator AtoC
MKVDPRAAGNALIVDDDPAVGKVLGALLGQAGIASRQVRSGVEALSALNDHPFDVVLTDLRMPGMDGMELLGKVSGNWPEVPVILMTAHGTIGVAVEAMKAGAADFILKPFDRDEILFALKKAIAAARRSGPEAAAPSAPGGMRGDSPEMKQVHELISRAASGTATVLLRGETGTGKEMAARAIHELSPRRQRPFIKFQCVALPETLLESELFGYERGAFTGAVSRKPGRVELAREGTLFLDEIGDLTPGMQVKFLRLLQDREFERLGGTETLKAEVRFVAATHRDLESMVQGREFREDLFYRLNVIPIWLPPLRARTQDIPSLARQFCVMFGAANGKPQAQLDQSALSLLSAQPWPGNVRQLQNLIERLVVLSDLEALSASDVERELSRGSGAGRLLPEPEIPRLAVQRREAELEALKTALQRAGNNRTLAARLLGISRRTLYNKLSEHGLA